MGSDQDITDEEKALFRQSMSDVQRSNPASEKHLNKPPPTPASKPRYIDQSRHTQSSHSDLMPKEFINQSSGAFLMMSRRDLDKRRVKQLKRGDIPIQESLDLHGNTIPEARQCLSRFLEECHQYRLECVLIIHGKGLRSEDSRPVLKEETTFFLQNHQHVLAFCSAQPQNGGTGAVMVLLREASNKS